MTEKTPGQAARAELEAAIRERVTMHCADDACALCERQVGDYMKLADAYAAAAQPDFTEHPACDAHRWWAVVKHVGSFAYGFAATGDGLRVYDDVSEFEHAKAQDFE